MGKKWWKEGVVYQIYPRSFKDSNGDGIGDIKGIIEKLDYIKELGVDIIWLNPVYKSPNDDNGYDISDYQDIMDDFGIMTDWEELLSGLHQRGIKLIMDLVVNHSSDEHKWFVESRKSKENKYRDYYIWRPPVDGKAPNNWGACFGGNVWEFDEITGEYYLHLFSKKQPDLNWANTELRKEVYDMMKWWLDKGIDGFRMDVINMIYKNSDFPKGQNIMPNGLEDGSPYYLNLSGVHDYLQEMGKEVLSKYDVLTVGECPGTKPDDGPLFSGEDRNELSMIFQFEHMDVDATNNKWNYKKWNLVDLKEIMDKWQITLSNNGWNSIYLMNHDRPRALSRFGNDGEYRKESAKMLATFTLSLQGTPYVYQGEEIGMTNIKFESISDYKDIETLNYFREATELGENPDEVLKKIHYASRDNSRTPMQWDSSEKAGFTSGTPWIKINENSKYINTEEALADEDSIFKYYQKMIKYRKENLTLVYGDYIPLDKENDKIYSYLRKDSKNIYFITLNFSGEIVRLEMPEEIKDKNLILEICNYSDLNLNTILRPYEARIYKIK